MDQWNTAPQHSPQSLRAAGENGISGSESFSITSTPTGEPIHWFAVETRPRAEEMAERNLGGICDLVFCPRYRKRTVIHGYRREIARPLFPGYLFAAFDLGRKFRAVHFAWGVRGVVVLGGEPARVPNSLIEALQARIVNGYVTVDLPRLRPGQKVEITHGPLAGFSGVFDDRRSSYERVAILLDLLGCGVRVIADRDAVRPL